MIRRNLHWLIILTGAVLRIVGLGRDALWYDEAFTAWLAGLPLREMFDAIAGDVHPPAWYLIEWAVTRLFGASEFALRVPACLIGIANVWLAWSVTRRLAPRPVALLATGIFALAPFQIYYSQEARMYQLLQCAVLLAVLAWMDRRWPLLAGASLLGLLTHNLMAVYLVVIFGLALTWRCDRIGVVTAAGVTAANYAPWAWWLLLPQIGGVSSAFWVRPLTIGGFFYPVYVLFFHTAAPARLQLHAAILMMALVLWGTYLAAAHHRTIVVLAWGPLAVLAIVSLVFQPVYLHRTLIGASLFLYLLAAFAIANTAKVLAQPVGVTALLLLPTLLIPTGAFFLKPAARRWDVRPDAASIHCQSGDVVYHANPGSLILLHYYLPECDHWLWPADNDLSQSLTQRTKQAMGVQQARLDDIPHTRAWLVWSENPVMDESEPGAVADILMTNNYILVHQVQPGDLVTLRIWEVWQ
jgi:uncharacterized membrane protein